MAIQPADVPAYVARVEESQRALVGSLRDLRDADARQSSGLPGWTRAHLLTHIARNGDTLAEMMSGAMRGEVVPQYGGSREQRDEDIAAGAGRSAAALVEDVARSEERFHLAAGEMTPDAWRGTLVWLVAELPATFALESRWREVEVHRVDLGIGYSPVDWPDEFVAANLPRELKRLERRAPGVERPDGLGDAETLAWLFGRPTPADLPALPPWG